MGTKKNKSTGSTGTVLTKASLPMSQQTADTARAIFVRAMGQAVLRLAAAKHDPTATVPEPTDIFDAAVAAAKMFETRIEKLTTLKPEGA